MTADPARIRLRKATRDDSDFLLSLRNDPVVVMASTSGQPVQPAEHVKWLARVVESDAHILNVIEAADSSLAVGNSRLDRRDGTDAVISIAIIEDWRSRSIGRRAILETVQAGFQRWSELRRVLAYVRVENSASIKAFEHAGFKPTDSCPMEGHVVLLINRASGV